MELNVCHEEGYILATTVGPIDDSARDLFKDLLHPLLGQKGTKLVLDLSQSKFINSNGIAQLVSLAVNGNTNGGRVVLASCSPFIAMVLDRSKLNTFFEIAENIPDAIKRILNG